MKRVCSILLCIALLLSLLPAAVLAGAAPALISTASLAMEPPAAGDTLESFLVTGEDGAHYALDQSGCCLTLKQGSEAELEWLYSDDVFAADDWYFAQIDLLADFGYQFADQVDVQVAGAAQSKVTKNEGDYIEILAWFPVGSPAEVLTPITAVGADHVVEATVGSDTRTAEEETESQAALTGDGYALSEVYYYKWVADSSDSYWSWTSGAFEAEQTYGVLLTLTAKPGYLFAQDVTASINGQSAQVMEWGEGTLEVFLPGDAITISYVEVTSDTWPIDGNPIDNTPDNFSIDSKTGYTLQFAEFQIEDYIDGSWVYRSLTPEETTFSGYDDYRVYAVLQADDGAVFDASVTGSFNGASGTECTVSEDQKTCVVTRTCKVYDPVYTRNNSTYEEYNGVTFRLTTPAAGQTPEDTTLYLTEGENYALYGVDGYYSWYEVPYAGSNRLIRQLSGTDAFEEGKVYLLRLDLDYKTGYRFAEGFTAEFLDLNGDPTPCARMETSSDTAKYKIYYLWYEVGEVNYQKVTDIVITGPAMGEDFPIPTNDLSAFTVAGGARIVSGFSYFGHLYLQLIPASGCYFGRQSELSVTYRVSGSDETYCGTISVSTSDHLGSASAQVVLLNQVWPSGLAVCDKTYDASTDAQLDLSGVTLEGVAEGDDVYLDVSQVTAAFADKNVGTDKPVTLDGVLSLGGADAGRYLLVDPELALTANITPCTTVINTTTDVQNVTQGVGTFDKPHIVGMFGEPGTAAERIDTDTGAITYSCGTVKDGTYEQVVAYLKTLNKGDTAEIVYTFTGNANYQNATFTLGDVQTNTGKIKVTIVAAGHSAEKTAAKPATCTETGNSEYYTCSDCGKYFSDEACTVEIEKNSWVIPAKGHSVEKTAAKDATCTEAGNSEYYTCSDCGKYFSDEACTVEIEKNSWVIVAKGHTEVIDDAVSATCTTDGKTEGKHCSVCDAVLVAQQEIPALGHAWDAGKVTTAPTATTDGVRTYSCTRCGATRTEAIPATGNTACDGGASCPSAHFTDEPKPGNWAHAGVDYAVANGLFNGMSPTTFEPGTAMTRAMLVTVLWRYEGQPVQGTNPFADVENGKWYTKPIAWASANGIVNGISADRFDPMGMVTREQLAAILYRYCGAKGIDNSARADLSAFPDVGSVSNYAQKTVSWAVAEGIIGGNKIDGVICIDPQGNATRAQVATIMMRFIENVVK